jgi:uncharacterized protein (TIGR03118 family)
MGGKKMKRSAKTKPVLVLAASVMMTLAAGAETPGWGMGAGRRAYVQHNLVSNGTVPADHVDSTLLNPWGVAFFPGTPFWINDNNFGISALYNGDGSGFGGADPAPAVTIPVPPSVTPPSAPTGIVANTSTGFILKNGSASSFIFDSEDGTLSAWNEPLGIPGTAELEVDNSTESCQNGATGAVYKGLALGENQSGVFLYATNFRCATVDVFDSSFSPSTLSGQFQDPGIPSGFAPFGIANVLGNLVVTYAKQDAAKHDDVAGAGNGFVDVYDTNGNLIRRLVTRGNLNSPWGIALTPFSFGQLRNTLLIGNFGDGKINAYNPLTGFFVDRLEDQSGQPISIDGLWSLVFGGARLSDPATLYFTSGPNNEQDGLVGEITPN